MTGPQSSLATPSARRDSGDGTHGFHGFVSGAAAFVLLALLLYLAAAPIRTNDFWFHLAAGKTYATEGLWPAEDPMLHTAHEDAPVQHEWLFGVATWLLQQAVGFHGLRLAHAAAAALAIALAWRCLRRAGAERSVAACAVAVFIVLSWWRLIQLRPDLFSISATLAVYLWVLLPGAGDTGGVRRPRIAAAAALALVWANVHSLFALGPLLVVAALGGLALRALLTRGHPALADATRTDGADARRLAAAGGAMTAIGFLNPRGVAQHLTFFSSSRDTAIWAIRDEWQHFDPFTWPELGTMLSPLAWLLTDAVLVACAALAAVRLAAFLRTPGATTLRGLDAVHLALAAASAVAMLTSIRFLWMGIFPLLYLARAVPRGARAGWCAAALAVAVAAAAPTAGLFLRRAQTAPRSIETYLREPYSIGAFAPRGFHFLRDSGVEGRLFNRYTQGGFLGYWLAPRLRTFVDGRTEHYRPDVLEDYFRISNPSISQRMEIRTGESAPDALNRRRVDLFFGVGLPVEGEPYYTTTVLEGTGGWLPVSRSIDHAIYLRDLPRNAENLGRIQAFYQRAGVPFDVSRGFDAVAAARSNPRWAIERGAVPPDYPQLAAAAHGKPGPRTARARERLALLYYLLGAYDEQIALDRELARARPAAFPTAARLTAALLRRGRDEEAAAVARGFAQAAPADPRAARLGKLVEEVTRLRRDGAPAVATGAAIDALPFVSRSEMRRFFEDGSPATGGRPDG